MTPQRWVRLALVAGAIAALEGACRLGLIPATVLIAPSAMFQALAQLLSSGQYAADIASSLGNIAIAALLAIVLGLSFGLSIHALPGLRTALEPLLASYYTVPTFIFYPVFIVLFGVGARPIIAIATLLAVVAMITATLSGLDRVPPVLRRTAQVMRLNRWQTLLRVSLPAALPYLFSGMKLAVAHAFIGVIASEFILSGAGIGYAIAYAYNNFDNRAMYALMLFVLLLVTLVNGVLDSIDKRLQARRR